MDKSAQLIMVVPRDKLFALRTFQGFLAHPARDFEARITAHHLYTPRGPAEENPALKQPIGYCVIINPKNKTVFAYRRNKKRSGFHETRLAGKWSVGLGGHVEPHDAGHPIHASIRRELQEEAGLPVDGLQLLGYINDDRHPVGQVHFGLLYAAHTDQQVLHPKDEEIDEGRFMRVDELRALVADPSVTVEEWTTLALPAVADYIEHLS